MTIVTGRLALRELRSEDATWIARDIANPNVQRWLTSPPHPYTQTHAEAFISEHASDPGYRVIDLRGQGCGVVSLTYHEDDIFDLGYWLAEAHWGQGFMTEAARALLGWQFSRDTRDVWSGWISGNDASRNVLTKLGFEPFGEKRAICHFRGVEVTVEKVILTHARWQRLSAPH